MLDTNIVSYLIRSGDMRLIEKFEQVSLEHTVSISSVTAAELFYGVKKKGSKKLEVALMEFLLPLEKYPFDTHAAISYGDVRVQLEMAGNVIGSHDMLIAAHAVSLGAVLVTNNEREFARVEGLRVENWTI